MDIRTRLKAAIDSAGLNMTQAAQVCGIPYRTLQDYLHGKKLPGAENLGAICTRLGISADWLLTGGGAMHRRGAATDAPYLLADERLEPDGKWMVADLSRLAAAHDLGKSDPHFRRLLAFNRWLLEWWEMASDDDRVWLDVQMRRALPEYAAWLAQRETTHAE